MPLPSNLDSVLDLLSEAVFVYNQDMEITHFNAAAERITGHRKEDVLGEKCVLIFDKSLCLNNCALCMTVKAGQNDRVNFESPFMRKEGARRMGEFTAGRLTLDDDGKAQVVVSLNDVTELKRLKQKLKSNHSFRNLIGKSPVMQDLFSSIQSVAEYDSTVCLYGESGTGKELVAAAIHYESPRSEGPLVKVNCSAFSDSLLESELFGHVKGAFTGAVKDRRGRFEEAEGGTLFLDEIGDLNPRVQVKLLRVLQEKEVERVGENLTRRVNLRIVAATHMDLRKEVAEGRFREDLFYRLNVIPLQLPSLRERSEDIPLLVDHFIKRWNQVHSKKMKGITSSAQGYLLDHSWPGNVRELENAIEHACVKATSEYLEADNLPSYLKQRSTATPQKKPRRRLTKKQVTEVLKECGHNQTHAARRLGIHRITLWRKMKELGIAG